MSVERRVLKRFKVEIDRMVRQPEGVAWEFGSDVRQTRPGLMLARDMLEAMEAIERAVEAPRAPPRPGIER